MLYSIGTGYTMPKDGHTGPIQSTHGGQLSIHYKNHTLWAL
jgi:hypothetical protein